MLPRRHENRLDDSLIEELSLIRRIDWEQAILNTVAVLVIACPCSRSRPAWRRKASIR